MAENTQSQSNAFRMFNQARRVVNPKVKLVVRNQTYQQRELSTGNVSILPPACNVA